MKSFLCAAVFFAITNFSNGLDFHQVFGNFRYQHAHYNLNISLKCEDQLNIFSSSLQQGFDEDNMWAWKMIDATSKLQSGILEGNMGDLGAFDECIKIFSNTSVGDVYGKYCLGSLVFKKASKGNIIFRNAQIDNLDKGLLLVRRSGVDVGDLLPELKWAACVPDACMADEISEVYSNLMDEYLGGIVNFKFEDHMCQTEEDTRPKLSKGTIVTILVFSIILTIMCLSTAYDLYVQYTGLEPAHIILIAFSVYTNGGKLFAINTNNPEQLSCLNGLRVISMMWVVLGHSFSSAAFGILLNGMDVTEWMDSLHSMYLVGASVSVDTFFFLSGLLMVYGFLKAMSKGVPFNVPLYWLHRYLRLTPAFAALIFMEMYLTPYFSSGPFWPTANDFLTQNCRNYWWSALLYLQNYINVDKICAGQSWYLSVDMQLFILSPLVLIPLWKWKKIGLVSLCVLILGSIAIPFAVAWEYNLSNFMSGQETGDFQTKYYVATHTRAAPWLIGILIGYVIFYVKQRKVQFSMNIVVVFILWAASLSVLITCVFGGHSTLRVGEYDKWPQVSQVTFVRPAWAIALSWLAFACITGYGGPINWFLSFPAFQVLGRLTYSVYLLHTTVLFTNAINSGKLHVYFSDLEMIYSSWGAMMFSAALAVLWNLAFESPMITIEKVLFHSAGKPKPMPEIRPVKDDVEKC